MRKFLANKLRRIEDEKSRKTFLIYTFGALGFITAVIFGLKGIKEQREALYYISLFSMAFIVAVNFVYFFIKRNINVAAHVIVSTFFVICLLLFAEMGIDNTGVLWYYVFSGLAILLTGTKKGVVYILLISGVTVFFIINPLGLNVIKYSSDVISRFFASFIIVNLFIIIFEYTRSQAFAAYMSTLEDVQAKNEKITSSINYASYIQNALLPSNELFNQLFPNNFVLFKPCDIVSGDFYFAKIIRNKIFLAVADCTGHGVPGAMMSMLGISLLNEIIGKTEIENSAQVLDELRLCMKSALQQTGERNEQKDGMDITIITYNLEKNAISFAGANNSMLLYRNKELTEIKGDKMPVGIFFKETAFTNHNVELKPDDILYFFSDGYQSQLGGPEHKKFKTRKFKEILLQNSNLPFADLKQLLEREFIDWKGSNDQTDDVLIVGIKLNN